MKHIEPGRENTGDGFGRRIVPAVAVVGAGHWGRNLVRNFNDLGALRTVCDTDPEILKHAREACRSVDCTTEYSEVLSDPSVQAVVIATPAGMHADMARAALMAGKDVFVEKPISLDEITAVELCDLAEQKGRLLMVGHLLWYHPAVLKIQQMLNQGELGRLQYIYSNRLNMGKLRREENVLWSFAPHDISLILGLVQEFPEAVQAGGGNFLHQNIADTTVSLFDFPSGVRAHIFVSWLHPYKEHKLVLVGDKKMVVFDDTADWDKKVSCYPHHVEWNGNIPTASRAEATAVPVKSEEPLQGECRHFLECIMTRTQPRTNGHESLRVLRVLNACQHALGARRPEILSSKVPAGELFVAETAIVDSGVKIGTGTKIWHFAHVLKNSIIGKQCTIGQNVVIGPGVTIGDGCKIQNNVSIYEGVTLERNVFCGPSMVFTNIPNPRSAISRKHEFLPTLVKQGCTIGANATIVCGNTLGRCSFVGAGAVVTRDVPDHALVTGNPARHLGWVCTCGDRLPDDLTCGGCGAAYIESANGLECLP